MQYRQQKPPKLVPKSLGSGLKAFTLKFLGGVWDGMGPDPRKPQIRRRRRTDL